MSHQKSQSISFAHRPPSAGDRLYRSKGQHRFQRFRIRASSGLRPTRAPQNGHHPHRRSDRTDRKTRRDSDHRENRQKSPRPARTFPAAKWSEAKNRWTSAQAVGNGPGTPAVGGVLRFRIAPAVIRNISRASSESPSGSGAIVGAGAGAASGAGGVDWGGAGGGGAVAAAVGCARSGTAVGVGPAASGRRVSGSMISAGLAPFWISFKVFIAQLKRPRARDRSARRILVVESWALTMPSIAIPFSASLRAQTPADCREAGPVPER